MVWCPSLGYVAKRIFLHVGTTKSGTTFLQRVMWAHRERLLEEGVLLPGSGGSDHFAAALDVREEHFRLTDSAAARHAWRRLVDEMAQWDGDALVTHELFAPASERQVADALGLLDGAEVHVVITARDLARQIPSEWQEHLKHRSVLTFSEFIHEVRDEPKGPFSPNGYYFWDEQDLVALATRWGQLPAGQTHLVTVPPSGGGQRVLWERFAGLIGIDVSGYDLDVARTNASLRAEQAELMRRLNVILGRRLPLPGPYSTVVKSVLAHRVLAGRPGTDVALTGEDHVFAVERAQRMVDELVGMPVKVVGDLTELVPDPVPPRDVSGDAEVTAEAVLDEAVEALAEVLKRLAAERTRVRRLRNRVGR